MDLDPGSKTEQEQYARNNDRPEVDMEDVDIVRGSSGGYDGDQFQHNQKVPGQPMPFIDTLPLLHAAEDESW